MIKTYKDITPSTTTITDAVEFCNMLAQANGSTYDPFTHDGENIIVNSKSYANPHYSKGMYAVLFMVDSIRSTVGYTRIFFGGPFAIISEDWELFIKYMKEL